MTTKRQTSISKHKTATTRKTVKPAQAFDIIPRSQVRPSANARPVISSGQPAVADNTMTVPSSAPTLNLPNRRMDLSPPSTTTEDTNAEAKPPVSVTDDEPTIKAAGVSVSDLIAKRNASSESILPQNAALTEDTSKTSVEATDTPSLPAPEAAASTSKPAPPIEDIKAPAVSDAEDDSVANALKSDDDDQPQEHSQALKEAIKDMDGDEQPHHELYGGKPVIVVHKKHGEMSALTWILWFIVCVGLAVLIVNFLIDADIIQTTYNVPHTDLL